MNNIDLTIIGGGPVGLFLGKEAKKKGLNVVIFDREEKVGGILKQCIHTGFGLQVYNKNLTGPELAENLYEEVNNLNIPVYTISMCSGFEDKKLYFYSRKGIIEVESDYYGFALGARERNRGNLFIEGDRPTGIFTAGFAQYLTNILGLKIGNKIAILGSGDIGLIIARRLKIEGMDVVGVYEIMPFFGGLPRNIKQCLEDFEIPLYLSHTIIKVEGKDRLEKIFVSEVDKNFNQIGKIKEIEADTLLLSVGLIPEIDILRKNLLFDKSTNQPIVNQNFLTNIPGVFLLGNSLTIFDLVDKAMLSSLNSLDAILNGKREINKNGTELKAGNFIKNIIPQIIEKDSKKANIYFRVKEPIFNKSLILREDNKIVFKKKIVALYPSQMEEITISPEIIEKDEVILEIV
ncbi:MAG TPA: FAD-dependent oxidoreductase [Caldisericia bacterium]|nr:FAD-dependent oxidoreductase [Caldisericia bacterium]HQL66200.1 FAD-dependent oxidoreductase [Caldisericia bacterium]HQN48804.1 FAD-dependent oxidoreductase [Caldisericia bacterium]